MVKGVLFLVLLAVIIGVGPRVVWAWLDCPFGRVNDPAPGLCGLYVDIDHNGICDHSELAPAARAAADDSLAKNGQQKKQAVDAIAVKGRPYNLVWPVGLTLGFYFLTWVLVKKKKLSLVMHRWIWNMVLLVSFLVSGLLGLLLVARINYGLKLPFSFNGLYWHVEAGIVMAIVAFIHIGWHWGYYKCIFIKRKKDDKCDSN
jgi:hypothetical protein